MKPHAGGHVDVEVGVVHPVQPPEHRHVVEDDVLHVDDEIEEDEADDRRQPAGQRKQVQQSPALLSRQQGGADRRRGNQQAHRQGIGDENRQIAGQRGLRPTTSCRRGAKSSPGGQDRNTAA